MGQDKGAVKASNQSDLSWLPSVTLNRDVPLRDQIYGALRRAIVTARIEPGTTLHEPGIAAHFTVSRTPVREALLRLREDGLVEIWRQSGTFVAPVDAARVEEGMLVREALEPRVIAHAVDYLTDDILSALEFQTQRMADAARTKDARTFIEADDHFHQLLVATSGYVHVAGIITQVNAQLDRVRYLSASEPIRARAAVAEHRQLLKCLAGRDKDASSRLLEKHLQGSWQLIRKFMQAP